MRALHIAATGMMAQEVNVQVISNNIANMRTTGYKRQRAEFQDLLYEQVRRVGSQTSDQGNILPAGVELGSGVKTVGTPRVMTQDNLLPTGKDFDVAIRDEGFYRIQLPDGRTAYSRDGSFSARCAGTHRHQPGLCRSAGHYGSAERKFDHDHQQGQVSVMLPGSTTPTQLGQFELSLFVNKAGLQGMGDNLYLETAASGAAQNGTPNADGFGNLQQGNLEQANVEAVTEISDLIAAQRAYEMNAKVINAADQMLQSTSNMMR